MYLSFWTNTDEFSSFWKANYYFIWAFYASTWIDNLVQPFYFLVLYIFTFHPLSQNSVLESKLSFKEKIILTVIAAHEVLKNVKEGVSSFMILTM